MRKQTKLVAVLSTAALLAVGASMTSFAAQGWAEENGTWVYYDKSGDLVTDTWAKSGDNWFFLDGNGEMAVDEIIEDGDNYYYVDENGAMATNKWIAVENEDAGNDNEPQQWWYYFQGNGKAMKGPDDGKVALKTVNGKKYAFNNDGQMLYGWVKSDDATIINDDEDAWQTAEYYFGDENDGSMAIGWRLLNITDPDADATENHWINPAFTDDEDQSRWFYFKTNGKKTKGDSDKLKESTINGKKYGFDEFGRMVAEWTAPVPTDATSSTASSASDASSWKYFNSVENGARVTKGWFKVVPAEELNDSDYNDDKEGWYYADNNGHIYANELKTINGKKYAFNEKGKMVDGLKFLKLSGNTIEEIIGDDKAGYEFDTEDGFNKNAGKLTYAGYKAFYFGGGDDGAMKTGTASVEIDGDKYNFNFSKSGSSKGMGKTGIENKKLYNAGKLVAAGKDEKYQAVFGGAYDYNSEQASKMGSSRAALGELGDGYLGYEKYEDAIDFANNVKSFAQFDAFQISASDLTAENFGSTKLGKLVSLKDVTDATGLSAKSDKYQDIIIYVTYTNDARTEAKVGLPSDVFYVVNTSGKISEKNTKNKDGNDTYYKLSGGKIVATYAED